MLAAFRFVHRGPAHAFRANAAGSVALGAGSVADQAYTVSIGASGSERRLVNVVAGEAPTDAANVAQLGATQRALGSVMQSIDDRLSQNSTIAYKGVAMAMAQGAAANLSASPGRTVVATGTGFYQGQGAVGVGIARASKPGDRTFRFGTSMSPDFGVQASMQWDVGPPAHEGAPHAPFSAPC